MTASFPRLLLMMLFLCSPALAADKVYKWTDENGVVHYDAKPPEQAEAQTVDIRRAPPPPPATINKVHSRALGLRNKTPVPPPPPAPFI